MRGFVAVTAAAGLLLGAAAPQPATWRLVQTLRVGTADGPGPYAFSLQLAIAARTNGALYVLDRANHQVRVFDARGRHIRTFGGEGAGPGEFLAAATAGWLADTLWVSDPVQLRTTFFSPDGRVLRTLGPATRASRQFAPAVAEAVLADGSLLVLPTPADSRESTGAMDVSRLPVLRVRRSGQADTLAWRDLRNRMMRIVMGTRRLVLPQPWDDSPLLAASPDGRSVVLVSRPAAARRDNARFRVTRLSASGDTVFSRAFVYDPIPVPGGWRERWADETARVIAAGRPGTDYRALRAALAAEARVPTFMPAVSAVVAGEDGTVWLRREEQESRETVHWTVLGANGRVAAHVRAPRGLDIQQVQRSQVWGVMTDDLDVPYIHRYAIRRPDSR